MLSELPRSCCYLSITVALLLGASIARAEKIRTAIPQANLNYLSIFVADAKGFFSDEGLENETVVISGPLSIAALLSGDVDYSGAGGSGMRAALKGAPMKGIYFQADKVTFYLVADPSIKTAADLKGQKNCHRQPWRYPGSDHDDVCGARRRVVKRHHSHLHGRGHEHPILAVKTGTLTQRPSIQAASCSRKKKGSFRWAFSAIFFPCPFRASSPPRKKSAKIRRKSSAGSKERSAVSCSCAIGRRKPSISASKNFSLAMPREPCS